MTIVGRQAPSQPDAGHTITTAAEPLPEHLLFWQPVTAPLRRRLFTAAIELLATRLPTSQSHLDPVTHYTPVMENFLGWLDRQPGESYQDRWLASGADSAGRDWLSEVDVDVSTAYGRMRFNRGLEALVCCGAIRPTYGFLLTVWSNRLWSTWREEHDTELFALIGKTAAEELDRRPEKTSGILIDFARMSIRTGKALGELTCTDLLDYRRACIDAKGSGTTISWATAYYCGRAAGLFDDGPEEFQALLTAQQLSPAQMVDQHHLVSPSMRLLLAEYLAERRPNLDYTSFSQLANRLCRLFWRDIENHHPGIDSHHLTRPQIEAWKARVMVLEDGSARRRPGEVFGAVRSFYLDINHWANDTPERWAHWAAPSPVTRQDVRVLPRERRRATARMHARVREFAPNLPALVRSAHQHRQFAARLLHLAQETPPGQEFVLAGTTYTRSVPVDADSGPRLVTADGTRVDPVFLEHEAFWSWAMIEVLRHAGIRIEELLELTHHSVRPYRKPDGTIVPLLQIAPSKTDAERVIPASPELASVLAQVISRVTAADGTIALVSRRDEHERSWSDPMPFLFQFRLAGRPRTFNSATLREYLDRAVERAGIGTGLTPHDFRRLFTTDAVNNGLPIHIAAELLGHRNLDTTMGYTAVYPQEVIDRYQQFVERRRALRPTEEYRPPTAAELSEFAAHFGQRRIEMGSCVRPYGTPCAHEHACLRCPFQQIEPAELPNLDKIKANIGRRIEAAREKQWLGDVAQLEKTLTHVDAKREGLLRLLAQPVVSLDLASGAAKN
ncbi:site-specific integrase [Amycolatopsis sp. DG1A-15b]|uniref:tyrosine-type recombinase/integrase n=1 Tax=Amycolatopsis sp. DG1A-15b TaxID=3052846 RepID=UPI00255C24DF|nr:site-specific integrase [Amycolatopsis sp. DG1A-15b]WIX85786.1 site-specific integrase [Amycolatopsis sp. DG1A-15b]WIX89775.1 site-specific integrase [Amycolatopsis sp. DG1A-15b]